LLSASRLKPFAFRSDRCSSVGDDNFWTLLSYAQTTFAPFRMEYADQDGCAAYIYE
jgi:hypothetical protein